MTTNQRPAATRRWQQLLGGVLLGALPGVVLVLAAQYLVSGEHQLTVGVAGMWLVPVGAVVGLLVALRRTRTAAHDERVSTRSQPG